MKDFILPYKPEELLAKAPDGRLWADSLPDVEEWSPEETGTQLDGLIGRLLASNGHDIAEQESFSLMFALIQAWPRLDETVRPRVGDLVCDACRRIVAEVAQSRKQTPGKKAKDEAKIKEMACEARTGAKVCAFFLRWTIEKVLRQQKEDLAAGTRRRGGGGPKGAKKDSDEKALAEEQKEAQKVAEKQRCMLVSELVDLICKEGMPWLWLSDDAGWQSVAAAVSDGGFLVLDMEHAVKHKETKQLALRCIAEPLLCEGHTHSNLLVATVSKLTHSLRGHELSASFAADALLLAHSTPLPRLFLVELTQHCTPQELQSQGSFQRSLGGFLAAIAERLPHVVLANISVLLPLLDVDCYPLRSAIVESIGHLLAAEGKALPRGAKGASEPKDVDAEAAPDAADETQLVVADGGKNDGEIVARFSIALATKKDLLETLCARTTDKTVWVRVRTLSTLNSLASNKRVAALPRDQWTRVLEIATKRMQDVASSARKAAMQLVQTLIEFHPYGPALRGSGDERAKADHVLREVHARLKELRNEELQAEAKAAGVDVDVVVDDDKAENKGEDDAEGGGVKRRRCTKKTVTDVTIATEVDQCLAEGGEGLEEAAERRAAQRVSLKRMDECYRQRVHFVELIDKAGERLRGLLISKTASDVTEAINVVVELRLRHLPAATDAFNQVLGLVWSRHGPVKDAAVEAFSRMHLEGRTIQAAVTELVRVYDEGLNGNWTYTHLASIQELLQQAATNDLIKPKAAIPVLVDTLQTPATCPMALRALNALGAASWTDLAAQLPRIASFVGPKGPSSGGTSIEQLVRVTLVCQLLNRLHMCASAPLSDDAWTHIETLLGQAVTVLIDCFSRGDVPPQWFGAAQAAMDLSFEVCSSATETTSTFLRCPDKLWEQLLNRMLQKILGHQVNDSASAPAGEESALVAVSADGFDAEPVTMAPGDEDNYPKVSVPQVGCVVFFTGHLALRMLCFLEQLQTSLKKKRLKEEDLRMQEAREKKKAAKLLQQAEQKRKKGTKGPKEEEEEDEDAGTAMGMAGQEEREAELFAEIIESRLLYGTKSLLDRVKPLVFGGLMNSNLRSEAILRRLSAISLCKFMTVSKRFCEEHLQLLFSVLFPKGNNSGASATLLSGVEVDDTAAAANANGLAALTEDLTLRQSLLVAVGDLLFRHPNVVEPWSDRLYAALGSDGESATVSGIELRLTALLVLTHLVLNDMMKPRAVMLVRALWLTACDHEATARVARILFQELSKRTTNVVYNLLPEIIARLPEHPDSADGGAVELVRYVMQFIEKEKQVEGLIDKLSVRLEQAADVAGGQASAAAVAAATAAAASKTDQQDNDVIDTDAAPTAGRAAETVSCLASALGSMSYSDKCIMRLQDTIVVRKALNNSISFHPIVRKNILDIVDKSRKQKNGPKTGAPGAAGEAAPAPDAAAPAPEEGGKKGAAALAALDAIEQTVKKLGAGQDAEKEVAAEGKAEKEDEKMAAAKADDVPDEKSASVPEEKSAEGGKAKGRGRGAKRGLESSEGPILPVAEANEDDATLASMGSKGKGGGRGRGGRGRGGGRGATVSEDKENVPREAAADLSARMTPAADQKTDSKAAAKPAAATSNLDRLFGGGGGGNKEKRTSGAKKPRKE